MNYISRKNIPENTIEERAYQVNIANNALKGNTLVVLPTGMGKTAVALIVAAQRVDSGKVLMLAPTKPLVEQHLRFFSKNLILDENEVVMFTGTTPHQKRKKLWEESKFCVSTPEVIKNDLIAGRYDLRDVSLLIVDECHRTVGNYAYVFIGERYNATASRPLVLAMTASPGYDSEHVAEICGHLSIETVESRVETDPDVRPYVHEREIEYRKVELPEELWLAVSVLNSMIDDRLKKLEDLNYRTVKREMLSMKALNALMAQIQNRMHEKDRSAYLAISVHAEIMKLKHGVMLAESQGSTALKAYLYKLESEGASAGGSKASKRILEDARFMRLLTLCEGWTKELHPKADEVVRIVREQLLESADSKIIVFVTYRDGVSMIVDKLNEAGISAERFVGQASRDSEKGLSQKEQIDAIRRFREGEYTVLVATSVGEEGLDIPSTDMVIFYESVPSEVRSIQRKGRTGRNSSGKITVLITKGTTDETYRWVSGSKEKQMQKGVKAMRSGFVPSVQKESSSQMSLGDAVLKALDASKENEEEEEDDRPKITIDNRELHSKVAEVLATTNAKITLEQMSVGDYAAGNRVLIERKTIKDFVDTLVERNLFEQIKALSESSIRPVLIIEGGTISDLYEVRNIHQNAIRNTLASIAVDFDVSVLFTKDETETAEMIYAFARRDLGSDKSERSLHRAKSTRSAKESVEYVMTAFPDVGPKAAREILKKFGSLKNVLCASKEELTSVSGVGEKTAESILKTAEFDWRR